MPGLNKLRSYKCACGEVSYRALRIEPHPCVHCGADLKGQPSMVEDGHRLRDFLDAQEAGQELPRREEP